MHFPFPNKLARLNGSRVEMKTRELKELTFINLLVYLGGRFLVGFGNSLAQLSCPLLLTEICHPQHRGIVTAIYNCLWNLGSCGR